MGELGSRLVRAREARGLTLEDAERDTRISRRYLEALESEQFEAIPAPVYARGFLRSYSQYLGMDPQEMLELFPRDDEVMARQGPPGPSMQNPVAATSPSRPSWRMPTRKRTDERPESANGDNGRAAPSQEREAAPPTNRQQPPQQAPARPQQQSRPPQQGRPEQSNRSNQGGQQQRAPQRPQPGPTPQPPANREPTIGVDIGVAAPARRIKPGGAGQARTLTVILVAVGAVLAVVLLAFIIANLGGGDDPEAATDGEGTATVETATATTTTTAAANPERGIVPDVSGLTASEARIEIESRGFVVRESPVANAAPQGTVVDQSPAGGVQWPEGNEVTIVVSDGP